jgi:predicted transport protein
LYEKFKAAILNLSDNIEVVPKKTTIAFKKSKIIADIIIQKRALKIVINCHIGSLNDSKQIASDISNIGHWSNGDYQIQVEDDKDLEYIMSLVKQAIH